MRSLVIFLLLFANSAVIAQNLRSGGILKPEQAIMDIRHYTLNLKVDPAARTIDGFTEIRLILTKESSLILLDLWDSMEVKKVFVDGRPAPFEHRNDLLFVRNGSSWSPGPRIVKVFYGGRPSVAVRPPWTGGFTWATDSLGHPWVAITCQGEGAKIYFPCKDHPSDEPNEGADLWITVPKGLVVAGPGLLQKVSTRRNWSTYHWQTRYTISNYCIVFNIGDYVVVSKTYTTIDGHQVPMQFYVLKEHQSKAMHHLELLERSCRVLEKYFGEYPWVKEKIGICETPHLGMEHQTMNAYGNKFRYTKLGGQDFDWLMHHEFGHEWWANKVTNIDWAHMWIQEGICSFGDALMVREMEGEEAYRKRMRHIAFTLRSNIPVVRGEEVDSDSAYKGPIYGKGAFFMHTLRYILGDSLFFPTLKRLATDTAYTYDHFVHTRDVEHLFSEAYGRSLQEVFHLFLYTTDKLEIGVKQLDEARYLVKLRNVNMPLPLDITTDEGTERRMVGPNGIRVSSRRLPVIDPTVFYLKRVIYE